MFEEIKRLLVECANVSEDDIKPESHLKKDLGIDSLYAVELTLQLEEHYNISIEWEEMHDVIYVKDVVKVNLWFWREKGPSGIFNCGTGKAHSYNEAAQAVIDAMGKGKIEYREFPEVLKGKYQSYTQADESKLLAAGYNEGFYDMKDAVKEYCDFLSDGGYFRYGK